MDNMEQSLSDKLREVSKELSIYLEEFEIFNEEVISAESGTRDLEEDQNTYDSYFQRFNTLNSRIKELLDEISKEDLE